MFTPMPLKWRLSGAPMKPEYSRHEPLSGKIFHNALSKTDSPLMLASTFSGDLSPHMPMVRAQRNGPMFFHVLGVNRHAFLIASLFAIHVICPILSFHIQKR